MDTYKYSALSRDGAKVNGVVEAIDVYQAVDKIKSECPVVLKIEKEKTGGIWDVLNMDAGSKKVDEKALSIMCSQFAIILSSGLGVDKCLELAANQTVDKRLKKMLKESARDVSTGIPLATAFEKNYPQLPVLFIESVRAGETAGTLPATFQSLAEFYRKGDEVNKKIRSALRYPVFVLVIAAVVLVVIMVRVMPVFVTMFDDFDGKLPVMTQMLISMTSWFQKWWLLLVGIAAVIIIGIQVYKHGENGRLRWAKLQLKMPLGRIRKLQACQQFANSMASLEKAGLPMASALDVTAKCMDNYAIGQEVHGYVEKVQTGYSLSEVIHESQYFPEVLQEMTGVGERTGEMVKTLETVADYYTREADYETEKVTARIEPTMLIVIAIIAGFIVIAIYLPMFTMYNYM